MKKGTKMINWLKKNKDIINLTGIEVRLEIPLTTLSQVIRENKPIDLPKKWVEPLRILACNMNIEDLERKGAVPYTITEIPDKKGTKLDIQSMVDKSKKEKK